MNATQIPFWPGLISAMVIGQLLGMALYAAFKSLIVRRIDKVQEIKNMEIRLDQEDLTLLMDGVTVDAMVDGEPVRVWMVVLENTECGIRMHVNLFRSRHR